MLNRGSRVAYTAVGYVLPSFDRSPVMKRPNVKQSFEIDAMMVVICLFVAQ